MRKTIIAVAASTVLFTFAGPAAATCDPGEVVIKFSHVTNTDRHPKGIAAELLSKRVNRPETSRSRPRTRKPGCCCNC